MTSGAAPTPSIMPAPVTSKDAEWATSIPHGARISVALLLGTSSLSSIPEPARHVRHRSRLSVYPATPAAGWSALQRLAALAQHHGHQCCNRSRRGRTDLVHWRLAVPAPATTDHFARGIGWSMAVLRAAPIRDDILGA